MNFTPELSAFQGAILSTENTYQFSKIPARGGNEEKILNIVTNIYAFLQEREYLSKEGISEKSKSILRKFSFYLILNGDFTTLEDMVEMPGIDTVIWTIPTIPKCVLSELIWGINFEEFLYEAITFCNPHLALQVIEPFIENIKYSTPTNCFPKVKLLSAACYKLICRFFFLDFDNEETSALLSTAFEYFLRCITYFEIPPNAEKLNDMGTDEKYKYIGNNLTAALNVLSDCMLWFTSTQEFDPEGFEDIYLLTLKPQNIKTAPPPTKVSDIQEAPLAEYLSKCNTAFLDKIKTLVMGVNVDIFCAWSEFEENGKSMQQSVGEQCYLLHAKLQKIPSLSEHSVVNMLTQISRAPLDINDIIRAADDDTIVENINKDFENRSLWLHALAEKENVLQNSSFIEIMLTNIEFIKEDDRKSLLHKILHKCKTNSPVEIIRKLILKLLSLCDDNFKEEMVLFHFHERLLCNVLETNDFEVMITESFNKFIANFETNLSEVYIVFLQNPLSTFNKIISMAIENQNQCDIMLKVILLLKKFSNHYYANDTESCLIKCIQNATWNDFGSESNMDDLVKFVAGLKDKELLSEGQLLLQIIMPNLYKALVDYKLDAIELHIKFISKCYLPAELVQYRAPILAMLGQVLEVVRWTPATFTSKGVTILEETLKLQMDVFKTYCEKIPDRELIWLKQKLRSLKPLNMYYYRKLWNPPGDDYLAIISGVNSMDTDEYTVFLTKVLCSTTRKEWLKIWDTLEIHFGMDATLDILYNSIAVFRLLEKENHNENSGMCVLYCYKALIFVTKEKYLTEPMTETKVAAVIDKIVTVINFFEEQDLEGLTSSILSLFSFMYDKNKDFACYTLTNKIKYPEYAALLNKVFTNGN